MKPEVLAKSDTEEAHQSALIQWALLNAYRHEALKWLHHIPNGGSRGDSSKTRAISGMKMKQSGVKKGIPDLFLPYSNGVYHGFYIEMKKPSLRPKRETSKGGLSEEQISFKKFCELVGYLHMVCYTWIEAKEAIENYLKI